MLTETDVANLALARLSFEPIVSIAEKTDRAKMVRPVWPVVLRTFLAAHDWSFAKREVKPARLALTNDGTIPYRYAYAFPDDMVKLRSVRRATAIRWFGLARPERPEVAYEVMRYSDARQQAIFTDAADVVVEYTSGAAPLDDFSPDALDALASKLAAELCLNLKDATGRAQEMIQRYQVALSAAKQNDVPKTERRFMNGFEYSDIRNSCGYR